METTSEFNLDTAIQQWRDNLRELPQFRAENLDELETHLRDSVETMRSKGLSDEEAFLIAMRRMGGVAALEPEFSKMNTREVWLNRVLWMLVGIQLWGFIGAVSGMLGQLATASLNIFGYPFQTAGQNVFGLPMPALPTAIFITTNVMALVMMTAGCWWLIRRNEKRLSVLLRRQGWLIFAGISLCLLMLLRGMASGLGFALLVKTLGITAYGKIAVSMSFGTVVLFALQPIALASLTVLIARRQVRLASS